MPPQPAAFEQMLTLMAGMEDDDEIDAMLTQVFQRAYLQVAKSGSGTVVLVSKILEVPFF